LRQSKKSDNFNFKSERANNSIYDEEASKKRSMLYRSKIVVDELGTLMKL
jgi:hypothetical protein